MTISPEQFEKLATKEDLKNFVTKDHLDKRMEQVLDSVDGLAKRFDTIEFGDFYIPNLAIDNNK